MQKIIIENFKAVEYAELEVKKVLILIGEQASGKSTIAKLIYFFKSLRDELFNQIYQGDDINYFHVKRHLVFPLRVKFYDFFGSTKHLPNFNIKYYYNIESNHYLELWLDDERKLDAKFSENLLSYDIKSEASELKRLLNSETLDTKNVHEQLAYEKNKFRYVKRLSSFVNEIFNCYHDTSLFVIAGRNATVSYSELFEKYLFANLQGIVEENKGNSFRQKEQTIDESLMLSFIERVAKMKSIFKKYGNFEGLIDFYSNSENSIDEDICIIFHETIKQILKGDYKIDNWGEKILLSDDRHVYLHNASSGQQEAIRILQDIFLALIEQQKVFRIIEEPEAHLFPEAQKHVIELLAMLINIDPDNQVIITTHSPYVLTVFNNLLFAHRVITNNPEVTNEVSRLIGLHSIIQPNDFAAYSLNSSHKNAEDTYCINLVNERTQVIDQNYLDTVSEELSNDFRTLYDLHTKSFAQR